MGKGQAFQSIRNYWNVSRLEYLPAEGPALFIPLLLGTATLAGLINLYWLEAVLAFALLYTSGFIINSYNDIEVDLRYKTHVAGAAKSIGRKNLLRLFIIQVALSIVIAVHLSLALGSWFILAIVLVGVFFATAYSVPPLHLKVRGVWHVISLCISAFVIPFTFFFFIVMGELPLEVIVLLLGFTVAHYGIALANQTGDYLEDKAEGLRTPAVRWGLDRTLRMAKAMTVIGVVIMLGGMFGYILAAPWLAHLEASLAYLPFPGRYLLMAMTTVIIAAGYSVPTRGLISIHDISAARASIEERMDRIKDRMNYPRWQASGIWSLAAASLVLFSFAVAF